MTINLFKCVVFSYILESIVYKWMKERFLLKILSLVLIPPSQFKKKAFTTLMIPKYS